MLSSQWMDEKNSVTSCELRVTIEWVKETRPGHEAVRIAVQPGGSSRLVASHESFKQTKNRMHKYRWQGRVKSAQDVEYPAYGITGPGPTPSSKGSLKTSPSSGWIKSPKSAVSGDKKLAHSAHMFHFQHQKQQVIAMEKYLTLTLYFVLAS